MSAVNSPGARVYDSAHQNFGAFRTQIASLDRYVTAHSSRWPAELRMTWTMFRDEVVRFLNEPVADMQAARQLLQAYVDALADIRRQWPRDATPTVATNTSVAETPVPVHSGFSFASLIPWALGGGLLWYVLRRKR